jgi:hypothetical protein
MPTPNDLSDLVATAERFASALDGLQGEAARTGDPPAGRTRRRLHELRELAGALLIRSETLARAAGAAPMVTFENLDENRTRLTLTVNIPDPGSLPRPGGPHTRS